MGGIGSKIGVFSQPGAAYDSEDDLADDGYGGALDDDAHGAVSAKNGNVEERDINTAPWQRCVDPRHEPVRASDGIPVKIRGLGWGLKVAVVVGTSRAFSKAVVRVVTVRGRLSTSLLVVDNATCTPTGRIIVGRTVAGDDVSYDVVMSRLGARALADTRNPEKSFGHVPAAFQEGVAAADLDLNLIREYDEDICGR